MMPVTTVCMLVTVVWIYVTALCTSVPAAAHAADQSPAMRAATIVVTCWMTTARKLIVALAWLTMAATIGPILPKAAAKAFTLVTAATANTAATTWPSIVRIGCTAAHMLPKAAPNSCNAGKIG